MSNQDIKDFDGATWDDVEQAAGHRQRRLELREHERLMELREQKIYRWSELNELCDLEARFLNQAILEGKTWGRWSYDAGDDVPSLCLNGWYEIELHRVRTTAELGDFLVHLAEKTWVTPDDLGNLVVALRDLEQAGHHMVRR